jgi:phage tail-like protein
MSSNQEPSGKMLNYLPSIFHDDKFLDVYLSAFDRILIGSDETDPRSLEAIVAGIARYFNPKDAPEEFLPWLSEWMAFGLRADLSVNLQREFLAQVISLYKMRGTPESLRRLIRTFTGAEPTILEGDDLARTDNADWNVAEGYQKWADGKPEHAFGVLLSFISAEGQSDKSAPEIQRKIEIAYALIDLEKPAHTIFYLVPVFPSMKLPAFSSKGRADKQIDPKARSRIGYDTLLGARRETPEDVQKKGNTNGSSKAS